MYSDHLVQMGGKGMMEEGRSASVALHAVLFDSSEDTHGLGTLVI